MDWTEPLYNADEMKRAEAGHDVPTLMQRAGRAVAEEVLRRFPEADSIGAVCGNGANGGDGRIALDELRAAGKRAEEGLAGDVLIDALFGTGFRGEPRVEAAELIDAVNTSDARVVAVDIPSGVDASTGEVPGAAVNADVTVTFHGWKVGVAVAPGTYHAGKVVLADIGLDRQQTEHALIRDDVLLLVPPKRDEDTKYTAGSVLVVGGAPGMTGAATLTATAAFRSDAGYVAVAAPAESLPVLEVRLVEAVTRPLDEALEAAGRASALAIGPGLGRGDERKALVRRLLETDLPAVVDADALWELEPFVRTAPTVLTPHSGELGRLLGQDSSWVDAHRLEAVRRAADRYRCVVVLKGADMLVAEHGTSRVLVYRDSPPSLATAGTGDVLTGIVAAFLAKGLDARTAAAAGAAAHSRAARLAGKHAGLIASDVVDALPRALERSSLGHA
jgi:ADP-dependent NAD(P)H-hydrate dehydratase / NAD(P)H-hydrate epimerase